MRQRYLVEIEDDFPLSAEAMLSALNGALLSAARVRGLPLSLEGCRVTVGVLEELDTDDLRRVADERRSET